MKRLILIATLFVSSSIATPATDPVLAENVGVTAKEITFMAGQSDEFNIDQIDLAKWNIDSKDFGPWSWEPSNLVQKDGAMLLRRERNDHQRRGQ